MWSTKLGYLMRAAQSVVGAAPRSAAALIEPPAASHTSIPATYTACVITRPGTSPPVPLGTRSRVASRSCALSNHLLAVHLCKVFSNRPNRLPAAGLLAMRARRNSYRRGGRRWRQQPDACGCACGLARMDQQEPLSLCVAFAVYYQRLAERAQHLGGRRTGPVRWTRAWERLVGMAGGGANSGGVAGARGTFGCVQCGCGWGLRRVGALAAVVWRAGDMFACVQCECSIVGALQGC